jgi:hypothetical protein
MQQPNGRSSPSPCDEPLEPVQRPVAPPLPISSKENLRKWDGNGPMKFQSLSNGHLVAPESPTEQISSDDGVGADMPEDEDSGAQLVHDQHVTRSGKDDALQHGQNLEDAIGAGTNFRLCCWSVVFACFSFCSLLGRGRGVMFAAHCIL